jgi:hypothetical protein
MTNRRLTAQEVFRNKIRGAFSSAGQKRGYKTDSQYIADIYKREALIVKILSDARSKLSESQLREFEGWLADQQRLQGSGYQLGVSEPLLGLAIGRVEGGSLDSALRLAVADLRRAGEIVQDFLTELTRLSLEISKEDFASALDVLREIAKKFGYSYWLIETEVALLSFSGKVELARERVKSVALGKRGLGPYIFHATGQRCDPSQSPVRHKALVKKRISESPIAEEMKAYLLYRINRELPPDESVLAALMGIEKSSCRQDVLMTGLQVCANIIARSEAFRQSTCELAWGFVSEFGGIYKPLVPAEHVESLALSSELANEVDEWVIEVISGASGTSSRIEAAFKAALDVRASEVEEYLHRYTSAFSWHPLALQLGGGGWI